MLSYDLKTPERHNQRFFFQQKSIGTQGYTPPNVSGEKSNL